MHRVRFIHWNTAEADEMANKLKAAGYNVSYQPVKGPADLHALREHPPDAVIIDLSRIPSHGRDVALAIRHYKATRHIPLIFVGGDPGKVVRIKKLLPDAAYTSWDKILGSLKRAIAHPPAHPVAPKSLLEGYSGTPLPKKLGIKANSKVALVNAPGDFEKTLGDLPEDVTFHRQARGQCDLIIWFTTSLKELEQRAERMADRVGKGGLWIVWPKKASKMAADISQIDVRRIGLSVGLVDYKVCAVDQTWSGLKFSRRKSK